MRSPFVLICVAEFSRDIFGKLIFCLEKPFTEESRIWKYLFPGPIVFLRNHIQKNKFSSLQTKVTPTRCKTLNDKRSLILNYNEVRMIFIENYRLISYLIILVKYIFWAKAKCSTHTCAAGNVAIAANADSLCAGAACDANDEATCCEGNSML